jgi:hypothetical protein
VILFGQNSLKFFVISEFTHVNVMCSEPCAAIRLRDNVLWDLNVLKYISLNYVFKHLLR